MFSLITMLVSTLGATGMASGLKMLGGLIDTWSQGRILREKRKMLSIKQQAGLDLDWQKGVFGNDEGGSYARGTRRTIALIGMCVFAALAILCTLYPSAELITFQPPESKQTFDLLWGLASFPLGDSATVVITTGHMALLAMINCGTIFGFYFTPGGRK